MKIRLFDFIVLSVITTLLIFLYIGFYYPDEIILSDYKTKLVLYSIRLLFPIIIIAFIYIYIGLRKRKIKKSNFFLSVISILISLIIVLHIGIIRFSSNSKIIDQFHPFLQLMPNPIDTDALQDTNIFRIVCIGGSTTEFTDTDGVGWPEYLEKYLNKTKRLRKIRVFNSGKQWYSTLHMLINYETNIRAYRPNVIIIMEAINDLLHNADQSYFSAGALRNDYGHFYGPLNRIARDTGFFKEYFYNRLKRLWYQDPREILELHSFPGLTSYRHYIHTIINLAQMDGTTVVLMTQPTLLKEHLSKEEKPIMYMVNLETAGEKNCWSYSTAWRGMEQYNSAMRSIAANRNVTLIDLEKVLPKNTEYFYDEVHYTNSAYPLIVKTIAKALISKSIIDKEHEK